MNLTISINRARVAVSAAVLFGLLSAPAQASTVLRKSLSDLAQSAELIFEGTVVSSTVVPGTAGQPPQTCVTFDVADVIAGTDPGNSLVLCFLGGALNGRNVVVTDMTYPAVGEHGIYLAESTHLAMVNPLAGWDQGRFLIANDPVTGAPRMMTAHAHPLVGLAEEASHATAQTALVTHAGVAASVVSDDTTGVAGAIGRDAFKTWLRSVR